MNRTGALRATAAAALAAASALACFHKNPPPSFYTLSSVAGPAAGAPVAERPDLGIVVGPLELPRYLDRPEVVTRDGAHRLVVADAHRWGGSLRTDVLRVVADDLGALLGTARIAVYPADPGFAAQYRVLLDVRELEGVPGEKLSLRVLWTIASLPDGTARAVEESAIDQPIASPSYGDLVAASSAALGAVSREIAVRVAELAVAQAPAAEPKSARGRAMPPPRAAH